MRIEPETLRAFAVVMTEGTVARAALELRTSRSNVRRILRSLEQALGERLFRGGRGTLEPTDAARRLQREMGGLMERIGSFDHAVRAIHAGGRLLRIGVKRSLFLTATFAAAARVLREDRRHRVSYVELEADEGRAALESGVCDLVFSVDGIGGRRFQCHGLPDMPVVAAVRGETDRTPVDPAELAAGGWTLAATDSSHDERLLSGIRSSCGGRGDLRPYGSLLRWMERPDAGNERLILCVPPVRGTRVAGVGFRPLAFAASYPLHVTRLRQHPFESLDSVIHGVESALLRFEI